MIKVLVFDFDGVILESVAVKDQAIYDLFEDATLEERKRVLELHRQTPGIHRRERIDMLLAKGLGRKASPDVLERLLERFAKHVWDGLMSCPEVPGVREFLEDVSRILPCYIISAAPQDEVRAVSETRDFSRYFVDIFGTPPSKTDRLESIKLIENVSSESILFIGDKISDFEAAQAVGARFIGRRLIERPTDFPKGVSIIKDFCSLKFSPESRFFTS